MGPTLPAVKRLAYPKISRVNAAGPFCVRSSLVLRVRRVVFESGDALGEVAIRARAEG